MSTESQNHAEFVTSWEAPSWASTASLTDDRIEYFRPIGTIFPKDVGQDAFSVSVRQSDELVADPKIVGVHRRMVQVTVLGVQLSPDEAIELASLLVQAASPHVS